MTHALFAHNLTIRRGKSDVVKDFSAMVKPGNIIAMVGRNGAGKSTIMSALTGYLSPVKGDVKLVPSPVSSKLASSVTFVSQGRPLYIGISVREHLQLAKAMNSDFNCEWADEVVRSLRIPFTSKIKELSGGQHTQIALILALAREKKYIVLDEPMADLDPVVKIWVRRILKSAADEQGVGILISSHTVSDLSPILTHLWVIENGELIVAVPREQIDNNGTGDYEKFVLDHLTKEGI